MITPDGTTQLRAFVLGRARLADHRVRGDAMPPVEPAVRSPHQTVHHVMTCLQRPAVENYFGFAIRFVVTVAVGIEKQFRRARHPHAAEADRDAAKPPSVIEKHFAFIEAPVAVLVREDQNTVAILHFEIGIRKTLHHPEPSAVVEVERDGLHYIRLAREKRGLKTFRQRHARQRLRRRQWHVPCPLRIHDAGRQTRRLRAKDLQARTGQAEQQGDSHGIFCRRNQSLCATQRNGNENV